MARKGTYKGTKPGIKGIREKGKGGRKSQRDKLIDAMSKRKPTRRPGKKTTSRRRV